MSKNLSTLLAEIVNPDIPLPVAELHRLSDLPAASANAFNKSWPTIALHRRRELVRHLAAICQTNFAVDLRPIALLGIRDQDSLVRLAALDTLWDAETPELIAPLLQLLQNDPDITVQASAAQVLGQFVLLGELGQLSDSTFTPLTIKLLAVIQDPERALLVRCRALESLAASSLDIVPGLIQEAYCSGEESFKISAVCAMGHTADTCWEPIIQAELSNVNPSMRYHAAQAAGHLELSATIPQLIKLLDDPHPQVILASVQSLGEIGGGEARTALELLLDDEEVGETVEDALAAIDLAGGSSSPFF